MKQLREQVKKEDVDVKSKSSHHSQTDAAKGFGGKFGVLNERQDKVLVCRCNLGAMNVHFLDNCVPGSNQDFTNFGERWEGA